MKLSWNRLALIVGAFILALTAVDGLVKLQGQAMEDYGSGQGPLVAADSAAALFLVGLTVGVVLGIGFFFGYLVLRERRCAEEPDEIDQLLEEVASEQRREDRRSEQSFGEEKAETLDPWEKPADWWKGSAED